MRYLLNLDLGFPGIVTDVAAVKAQHHASTLLRLTGPVCVPKRLLRQDVVDWLAALDINIKQVNAIKLGRDDSPPPHCDDPGPGDWGRIMWWDGQCTDMTWYQLNEGCAMRELRQPVTGATHYMASFEQVTEIHRVRLPASNPILVRTGVLHSGFSDEEPPCFGWQIWPTRDGHSMTFDQLADALAPYVLD